MTITRNCIFISNLNIFTTTYCCRQIKGYFAEYRIICPLFCLKRHKWKNIQLREQKNCPTTQNIKRVNIMYRKNMFQIPNLISALNFCVRASVVHFLIQYQAIFYEFISCILEISCDEFCTFFYVNVLIVLNREIFIQYDI